MSELKQRVDQFRMMELPGQPMMMHMGTSRLVDDLWGEVDRLRAINEQLYAALESCLNLLDVLSPLEGDEVRKDRSALARARGEQESSHD